MAAAAAAAIMRLNYYWPIVGFDLEAMAAIENDRVGCMRLCERGDKSMPLISATREIIHQLAFDCVFNAGSLV